MSEEVFKLHVLPAGIGDALVLEYGTKEAVQRVVVDGGVKKTSGILTDLLGTDPTIELLMVTHIDNDHIAGMLDVLETGLGHMTLGDVWFNGFRHLPQSPLESMGPVNGERLTTHLVSHGIPWNVAFEHAAVMTSPTADTTRDLPGGLSLRVLSPGHDELFALRKVWLPVVREAGLDPAVPIVEEPLTPPGRLERMGAIDVAALAARTGPVDVTEANGSSIAVIAEWAKRSCLLTGDAHADVLVAALDRWLGPAGTLDVDVFKLPHHGSKANVTNELMRRIRARVYVFSSSGEGRSRHPNDEAVARAIVHAPADAMLAFNHRNPRTELWDADDVKAAHGYRTQYPTDGAPGVTIDLMALPV